MIAKATAAPTHLEVARVIVEEGIAAIGGWIGALWLTTQDGTLELVHHHGVDPGRRFRRIPIGSESPVALAVRTSTPVWIGSRAEYVAAFPQSGQGNPGDVHALHSEIACACLPLVAGNVAIGSLMFAYRAEHDFDDEERTFLVSLASQCAHALERLRLLESVSRLYAAEAEARRQAEAANRAKDEFLALLGHELRNPLAPIVTALSLMKLRRGVDHERERAIIERQVHHLVRLVDDLLDISRITRGSVELVRAPVPLAKAVTQSVEAAQPIFEERGHRLSLDLAADLVVDADIHRLAQVISNLLTNAAKYTPDGGHVALAVSQDGDMACIKVTDNGVGIPPNLLPRVFDMFVQGERSPDRSEGGLGLGLAVVKNLVERHGGRVAATSEGTGKGSTFTVWWPLASGAVAATDDAPGLEPPTRPLRVLVVDDNVDAATTLGELLKVLGHQPLVAHDAPSALELAREGAPQVALVDLGLPILDGFELIGRLRSLPGLNKLPAVAVTGYGQASDRARSQRAGFDRHVVKPVGLEDLRSLLASL